MTIGVGFVCRDGIVIASDRQITNRNRYTFQDQKTYSFSVTNGLIAWSYAGNADVAKRFQVNIEKQFIFDKKVSVLSAEVSLKKVLRKTIKKGQNFQVLLGFCPDVKSPSVLLASNGFDVLPVDRCEVIGYGDSPLARYLRGLFLQCPFSPMLQQAAYIAIHFVLQAKRYDGEFCGGGTDVWGIGFNKQAFTVGGIQAEEWEKQISALEFKTSLLFRVLTDRELSEDRKQEEWEVFISTVKSFQGQVCWKDGT